MQLSEHFSLAELTVSEIAARKGLDNLPEGVALENLSRLAEKLEEVRKVIGKPIMITENDHNVKLYNGDIGLCLAKGKVWFGNREVSTSRIPAHEPAFMMTMTTIMTAMMMILTTTMTMDPEDMKEIGLAAGQMAIIRTDFGEAIFRCEAGKIPRGMIFVAYGPPTCKLMGGDTDGTGMPMSKGWEVEVIPQ